MPCEACESPRNRNYDNSISTPFGRIAKKTSGRSNRCSASGASPRQKLSLLGDRQVRPARMNVPVHTKKGGGPRYYTPGYHKTLAHRSQVKIRGWKKNQLRSVHVATTSEKRSTLHSRGGVSWKERRAGEPTLLPSAVRR